MALLWVHVCSQYTTTYPSKPSPYEATEFILLVSWTVRVVVQDIYTATSTIQSLGVGLVFLAMRYLWHRDELSACTMAMCCGSPYHLILSPITIWSVESRELFCLCLAITGAQTLRTNQALKVGQLDPTQLRGIGVKYIIYIYILSTVVLSIYQDAFRRLLVSEEVGAGGSYNYTKFRAQNGCPIPILHPTSAGRTRPCCVTRPRNQQEQSGPTT